MRVVDLTPELEPLYLRCLEDWDPETEIASVHRACWYSTYKERGLRVKLATDDDGRVGGMIQYVPIEDSPAVGRGLYFVLCVWVHGHDRGRGNFQGRGMGRALLSAAEEDARARGALGMAAWGLPLPIWMRASWFVARGYRKVERRGIQTLVWKPFSPEAEPPRWPVGPKLEPQTVPGKVTVTGCMNGWCLAMGVSFERAKRAAEALGPDAVVRLADMKGRPPPHDWDEGLFVDDRPVRTGPPPTAARLARLIRRRAAHLATPR